ncbi:MAG: DUF58 domain-containing protein [Methanomicrobiaceae archaeon]|nr:DUF58 domain-containing protein [Methanomicrobiaceae archaeon]
MGKNKEFVTIIIVIFFAAGLIFRDERPLFAAFSLSLIILLDLYIFNQKINDAAKNSDFLRISDKKILLRGTGASIRTDFELSVPKGLEIQVEDQIPKGSVVTGKSAKSPVLKTSGKYSVSYDLLCLAHGINRFEGIKLDISGLFFSKSITLKNESLKLPQIKVYPRPSFIKEGIPSFIGKKTEKKTIIRGEDVKGVREYNVLDDIRTIDWKASAKHDKLFVKEYSGLESVIETIFVDLPDYQDPESEEKLEIIKGMAGSVLLNKKEKKQTNLIMISGANLIESKKSSKFADDAINIINRLSPFTRDKYLYRYFPKRYNKINDGYNFKNSIIDKAGYFFSIKSPHLFEKQIYGALEELRAGEEIHIITIPDGDMSHLRIIAELSGIRKLKSICFIPKTENFRVRESGIFSFGFDEVNII